MPLLFQKMIYNADLRRNRDVLYVFGDNIARKGLGGQAKEMRGEPNAVGVATKRFPHHDEDAYFEETPEAIDAQKAIIDQDMKPLFEHLKRGGIVIWPADGIGTGIAELKTRAPTTYNYVEEKLTALIKVARLFDKGEEAAALRAAEPHL
jgi:hypothetical protein